jgi:cell division protein FtsN
MARRELRPAARLFVKKRTARSRAAGALLLTLSLGVAGFGIATAVYLEQPAGTGQRETPQVMAAVPAPPHDPLAAAAAVPSGAEAAPPPPIAVPALEPQAGASVPPAGAAAVPAPETLPPVASPAPEPQAGPSVPSPSGPPAQTAALEPPPPPAAPPPVALAAPVPPPAAESPPERYWVEYGVFAREPSALRLQQELRREGLAAIIVATHGRDGRKLLRVRSAPLADLGAAQHDIGAARRGLRLAALLHRGSPAAATAIPAAQYRVQFGAFAYPQHAAQLSRELSRGGLAVTVSSVRGASGKPLYLVRSLPVPDHAQAVALGARGQELAQTDFLIERSPGPPAQHLPARAPPRPVADSR